MKDKINKSLSVAARIALLNSNDIKKVGSKLSKLGADELADGGFWILPLNESNDQYLSPKFRFITGYEKDGLRGKIDFYNLIPIDILKEFRDNLKKQENFFQSFVIKTRGRNHILLYCDVSVIKNKMIIISANKVIKK